MKSRHLSFIPLISNRTKIIISIALLLLAIAMCFTHPENFDSKLCMFAMIFSFLGDILLNCMPLEKRPHSLLYLGALFFMVSHLLYASAYYFLISFHRETFINTGSYLAFYFIAIILAFSTISILISKKTLKISMLFVFLVYLVIISINFITICSYSWIFKSLSCIGALSFLISDYIIGIETVFKVKSDLLRKLVWIFYPVGQFLIIVCR